MFIFTLFIRIFRFFPYITLAVSPLHACGRKGLSKKYYYTNPVASRRIRPISCFYTINRVATRWAKWPKVGSLKSENGPFQVGYLKKRPISGGLFLRKGSFQVGCKNPVATLLSKSDTYNESWNTL